MRIFHPNTKTKNKEEWLKKGHAMPASSVKKFTKAEIERYELDKTEELLRRSSS